MKYLCNKYGQKDFTVFGQFAYDVQEPEKNTNKQIAHLLNKHEYLDNHGLPLISNFKFLEKVSEYSIFTLFQIDINGSEMHGLYKFAKRNSPDLFVSRYGMAKHIYNNNCKFLFDRYGTVKHFYN